MWRNNNIIWNFGRGLTTLVEVSHNIGYKFCIRLSCDLYGALVYIFDCLYSQRDKQKVGRCLVLV